VTEHLNLIASFGRAFRSPNLIERFFRGATPEGSGYQLPNPDLKPEWSFDVDLGAKLNTARVYAEGFVFRNEVHDGIRIAATGSKVGQFPAYRNINVDHIRDHGAEFLVQVRLPEGFNLGGTYTRFKSKDVLEPLNPVGDTYSSKITGSIGWRATSGRLWSEYAIRVNGERKDVELGSSPIGPVLPGFTTHSVRAGAQLFRVRGITNELNVVVNNLTNTLYAEFANASFFRPEPKRTLAVAWTGRF
jgi:outer membrane receptor protein involved in Fe transport